MNENKLKHLEFIQNVITRMNSNSFLIKGWAVTLMSALFALSAKDANVNYILVVYFVIPVFWFLDGFFLSTEKKFRKLYQDVADKEEGEIDFSMNIVEYSNYSESWLGATLSKTLIPFYGFLLIVVIFVMFLLM